MMDSVAKGVATAGDQRPSLGQGRTGERSEAILDHHLARAFFDVFTCGLVLTDQAGTVVATNPMVRVMLDLDSPTGAQSCCELFRCRDPDGPLDGACLTEQTLANGRLRDLSLRLPGGSMARSALITSTPTHDGHVLVEVQLAGARAGVAPRAPVPGRLTASMFGRMRLEDDGGSIGQDWLEHRPGQLLKLLITERDRIVTVDEIAEALWTNAGPPGARNVRQCVYAVRSRLNPHRNDRSAPSVIIAHRGGYSIDRRRLHIDCDEFEAQVGRGMEAYAAGQLEPARKRLTAGLELYRGEYLADEPYAHWALAERTRLAGIASDGLRALAIIAARRHDYADATRHLERLAAIDDYDMDVQRGLIALCMARGRRSEAKRRYMALRSRLRAEFDEEPDFEFAEVGQEAHFLGALLAM